MNTHVDVSDGLYAFSAVFLIVSLMIGIALYVLPSVIASKRNHPQFTTIILLNILCGWTFVVWVVCMVWACMGPVQVQVAQTAPALPSQATRFCSACGKVVSIRALACPHCGDPIEVKEVS
jgi:hypothetical protein